MSKRSYECVEGILHKTLDDCSLDARGVCSLVGRAPLIRKI